MASSGHASYSMNKAAGSILIESAKSSIGC